jgi:hypothetical protein
MPVLLCQSLPERWMAATAATNTTLNKMTVSDAMALQQPVPKQPVQLDQVQLHAKKTRGHPLEEDIAREIAHDFGRCVIAMTGMRIQLHKPLRSPSEQESLAKRFLELTSTPNGWWQQALDKGIPSKPARGVWDFWVPKAKEWLASRESRR